MYRKIEIVSAFLNRKTKETVKRESTTFSSRKLHTRFEEYKGL